jgi:nucleoid-associated protein YgaU
MENDGTKRGSRLWIAAIAGIGALGAAALVALVYVPASAPPQADGQVPAAQEPVVAGSQVPAAAPADPAAPEPAPASTEPAPRPDTIDGAPPSFDTVRVEPDGNALVAGQSAPNSAVTVMVDGAEAARGDADANGNFVLMFDLPAAEAPRLMTLESRLPDGSKVVSQQRVALAPTTAPDVMAAADPAPAASAPPAQLLLTDDGASLLAPPEAPEGQIAAVTIDTISYAPDGAVQLSGQGAGAAFLRLYLDNAEVLTLPLPPAGAWRATLPEVAPGIYTLRADQLDAEGRVLSRFETPFKHETPEALAAVLQATENPPAIEPAAPAGTMEIASAEPVPTPAEVQDAPVTPAPPAVAASETVAEPAAALPAEPPPAIDADQVGVAQPAPAAPATEPDIPEPPKIAQSAEPAAPAPEPAAPVAVASDAPVAPVAPEAMPEPAAPPRALTVTVQPGFTLWQIASENFGDGVMYVQVYEANRDKIRDPDLIYPGQVFAIPEAPAP